MCGLGEAAKMATYDLQTCCLQMIFEPSIDNISVTFDLQLGAFFSKASKGALDKKKITSGISYRKK